MNTPRFNLISMSLLLATVLISSCNITKKYKRPDAPVASVYRGSASMDSTTLAAMHWQEVFSDTLLQRLIKIGLENNMDLKIAVARVKAAQANVRQSKAAFLPTLTGDADFTRSKTSAATISGFGGSSVSSSSIPTIDKYSLIGTATWEIDVWGKLRSNKRAYVAALLQSDAYRRAVQTQLIADIANNYYALLAYDKQVEITEQTLAIRKDDIETVKALKETSTLTGADVAQSEASLYAAAVSLPDLMLQIRQTENALSTLLGQTADSIPRGRLEEQVSITNLSTGVPAQLLANRPDVIEAELSLRNAFELTNVARTYFYPELSISSATGGWATVNTLAGFFDGTFYGSIIGGLTQPILNQGLNNQRLRVAKATQEEALYTFKSTVLTAGEEVSNALFSYKTATDKARARKLQLLALQTAVDDTKELMQFTSSTNYTDVLTSETNLLSAQLSGVEDRLQQLQAIVNLYVALGGGWQ